MKLKINGNIARWEDKQAVASKPFDVEIEGLRDDIEWYYATPTEKDKLRGNTLRLNVEPGELKISFSGYVRGKKVIDVFSEPLVISEQETDVYRADPLFSVIAQRIAELNSRITRLEEKVAELESQAKTDSDRITIIENGYDILQV